MRRFRRSCTPTVRALSALTLALIANALSVTNVFPYAPFMVKWLGLTDDDRELGFYAGFFMTILMVGSGLSALFWGHFSDRYGKKLVITIALWSCTVPQVLFGLSTSMWAALTTRFFMGLLNGLVGAAKALAPELVPPSEQAGAMSLIAASWGVGNLFGPALGGLLSLYRLCEEDDDEGESGSGMAAALSNVSSRAATGPPAGCPLFPFLPPNLLCAVIALLGLAAVHWMLPDDRRPRVAPAASRRTGIETATLRVGVASDAPEVPADAPPPDGRAAPGAALLTRQSCAALGFYFMVALNDITMNEVFPLWAIAPIASGGLGLDASSLGGVLSASGLALLAFQLLVFPPLSRRVSLTRLCKVAACASCAMYAAMPFATALRNHSPGAVLPAVLALSSLWRFCLGTSFTCTFAIINNVVAKEARGRMQGVAMTAGSLARALGPTLGAELFAWSLTNKMPLPLDFHFVFLLLCALQTIPAGISLACFTEDLDRPLELAHAAESGGTGGSDCDASAGGSGAAAGCKGAELVGAAPSTPEKSSGRR